MKDTPQERVRNLTRSILSKIEKNKRDIHNRELTNEDVALVMAEYSITHLSTLSDRKREILDEMLTKLDEKHMDIVNMYFWGGKTMAQISDVYGRSGDSGTKWVSRKLQEAYQMMRAK